ncbi:hypothetical protein CF70_032175 [Cupriavidus sp. SK-3]|nr:hypothetical protein CF70_032175 [Cupriavidus sp. SK-3]
MRPIAALSGLLMLAAPSAFARWHGGGGPPAEWGLIVAGIVVLFALRSRHGTKIVVAFIVAAIFREFLVRA